jgi:hypothetical protein
MIGFIVPFYMLPCFYIGNLLSLAIARSFLAVGMTVSACLDYFLQVGPQDIVVIPKDEYEDDTTQSSSDEETQDDRYDAASWETADSDGMHIHDQEQQVRQIPFRNSFG